MTSLNEAIRAILDDPSLDDEESPSSKQEEIEKLIVAFEWPAMEAVVLELLATSSEPSHWRVAAEVLWGAALDRRTVNVDRVIAHLCLRYPPGRNEDNLAWSITCTLKQVYYLSDYDPLSDPGVLRELDLLRSRVG